MCPAISLVDREFDMCTSAAQRIHQAQAGDRDSLELLLLDHSGQLRKHIARSLPSRYQSVFDVDDIMQEVLTSAFLNIGQLQDTSPLGFNAWLMAIADLTLINSMRVESAQKRGGDFNRREWITEPVTGRLIQILETLPGNSKSGSSVAAHQEAIAALQVAIAGLPTSQRRAVQIYFVQGKSLEQTCHDLALTPGAVRGLLHRAKVNLSEAMGRASAWLSG